jgi:hypothetical protein
VLRPTFIVCVAVAAACATPAPTDASSSTSGTTASSADSGSFVAQPDGGAGPRRCDFLDPDCDAAEKCVAYDLDGDATPEETRCVPVTGSGEAGDPCQRDAATGADDCGLGLTCFDADDGAGNCVPNCIAPQGVAICADPDHRCLPGGGPLHVCLAACDPRAPACEAGESCYPSSEWLLCLPDVSGEDGAAGQRCTFVNGCDPGLACVSGSTSTACADAMCCTPFCTVGEDTCPPGDACMPFFADGGPSTLLDLGLCRALR